jgi:hypothetical protein
MQASEERSENFKAISFQLVRDFIHPSSAYFDLVLMKRYNFQDVRKES